MAITLYILPFTHHILCLGCLLNYISMPVVKAFSSAVAIQVSTSQVKGLLGLKVFFDIIIDRHLVVTCNYLLGAGSWIR